MATVDETAQPVDSPVDNSGEGFEERTGVVIVAIPAGSDPIVAASSEDIAHMTLIWLGDLSELTVSVDELKADLAAWAQDVTGPLTEGVSGSAVLGEDKAQVVLIDATALAQLRNGMVQSAESDPTEATTAIAIAHRAAEQFPTWIPHVTLGYPETPPVGEFVGTEVTFDRFALWIGNDRTEYPFGGAMSTVTAAAIDVGDIGGEDLGDPEEIGLDEDLVDEQIDEIPVHGVLTVEGVPTGDGREFAIGAVSSRPLPLPIRYEYAGTHGGTTSDVSTVGRMDEIWRFENAEGIPEFRFRGVILSSRRFADEVIQGIADGSTRGISIEIDDMALDVAGSEASFNPADGTAKTIFSRARICGHTIVPIGAYQEAYIALGHAFEDELTEEDMAVLAACGCMEEPPLGDELTEDERVDLTGFTPEELDTFFLMTPEEQEGYIDARGLRASAADFAPGTKDGPGWITNPDDTARLRRYWTKGPGAAKIKWGVPGDFNRCRTQLGKYVENPDWLAGTCANMHKEALGVWPGQESGGRGRHAALLASGATPAPLVKLVAAGRRTLPHSWFQNPQLDRPTGVTITEEGRVYGHVAAWGVCHIGMQGACTTAPHSITDYAYFATGTVVTDEGTVNVGQITMGNGGHAGDRMSAKATAAHYDRTSAAVADIAVGEDDFGIWFAGAMRPSATEQQIHDLRASGRLSGDWRLLHNNLELVAALAVNVPGFPIPHTSLAASAYGQLSLVAAGIIPVEKEEEIIVSIDHGRPDSDPVAFARTVAGELHLIQTRPEREAAARAAAHSIRQVVIERARAQIGM